MKLHCSKILLFFLPLNMLVTSYQVNTHKKTYITTYHTQTNRSLFESDVQSSIYDKDEDMKSVKENFERQTSQRLREYDERMQEKRHKRKEERDKNIQKIIQKDKMENNLAEKIEKGCLRCGCGLGGVAASVGLFGGLGIYGWEISATAVAAKAAGDAAGMQALIKGLEDGFVIKNIYNTPLKEFITTKNYCDATLISKGVELKYKSCLTGSSACENNFLFSSYKTNGEAEGALKVVEYAKRIVGEAVEKASKETLRVTASRTAEVQADELAEVAATSYYSYSAIGYSVLVILIIVLVMIIIYLVLRYRRKKKMNKKSQYTKLLNQ
ncbi:rifin [Plasmodium reichenowi]|uniref:Rifin n=1 Tax=Plasmodium reichenowi TaxID=5854 RepID=A0A060RQH5_PLARE|nr:rifin [Plasmodium reichenowi]